MTCVAGAALMISCCVYFAGGGHIVDHNIFSAPSLSHKLGSAVAAVGGRTPLRESNIEATSAAETGDVVDRNRFIIVCTLTYQHIFQRPNLARTAAQLMQAGPNVLWIVTEDTHWLRQIASNPEHFDWIINSTRVFIASLGLNTVYIAEHAPFKKNEIRSAKIQAHQRNLGLAYVPPPSTPSYTSDGNNLFAPTLFCNKTCKRASRCM
jgi:hypothetical protein